MARGVSGQDVRNPQGAFVSHFVVKVGEEVLDPSYRRRFPNEDVWETNSLEGYLGTCWFSDGIPRGAIKETPGRQTTFRPAP